MKRIISIICLCAVLLGMSGQMWAQDGTTCYRAIPLGDNYTTTITGAKTVWYTAWTYDLPLSVYFIPSNPSDPEPEVMMDFGCTPGVYADPIICMLFCKGGTATLDMPHKPKLSTTTIEGRFAYYLSMGKSYRDMLLKMGIDYNVQVFVKVTYKAGGEMSIAPDNMFSSCMDGAKFIHFGDTLRVRPDNSNRHVVVPYVQWQNDSIRYTWQGTTPCTLLVGSDCRFTVPFDGLDESVLDVMEIQPGGSYKVPSSQIKHYVNFVDNEAGMFFAKCVSDAPGVLTVEQVPMDPPKGGAKLLHYDEEQVVMANDTDALFAIAQDWTVSTRFYAPTNHIFRMYIGKTATFTPATADTVCTFLPTLDGHEFIMDEEAMKSLWKKKAASENYLYIRFACTTRTSVIATQWAPSPCVTLAKPMQKNKDVYVDRATYTVDYFRFHYPEWTGGDMIFGWQNKNALCNVAIADTCSFIVNASDPHVVYFFQANKRGNSGVRPYTIPADTIAKWRNRVDEDGYLYVRFNAGTNPGYMSVQSTAPEETDPVYPAATVAVTCVADNPSNLSVSVSVDQHLTLKNAVGTTVTEWDATVNNPHSLNLSTGLYTLVGTNENITIQVP